ncbi:hypothetical protein [Photobacterium damselae]|uniref:DUF4760 domain-containing protein n=2 Tax=Photobacterium damselae TaxID=38293 RepID=D0Z4P6_PHODD|nr:hypothetical protein [Photobacterium damselae]EEZ39484.1 hypothetical protein VDA_000504 [Photobacterium damselae subsp. damselae CIP 102761]PSW86469.1 hypothetical protein CTN07_04890 [Photobacterium damselae]SPY44613.1 Uncharacterised protein [Photobacterium damselae]
MKFEFLNTEIVALVNFVAAMFTIAAAVIALITLLSWKKQQLLGPKLNAVLEAEDCYCLVVQGYMQNFSFFFHCSKLAFETRNAPKETRAEANNVISRESEKLNFEKQALHDSNFQLAVLRMQRLGLIAEIDKSMDTKHLTEIFEGYLERIQKHDYSDEDSNNDLLSSFAHEIYWIQDSGKQAFKTIRDSL